MECSICYDEINSSTGKVELSCAHPFHFSCIAKWFDKQRLQESCESCPLCRNESNDFQKMPDGIYYSEIDPAEDPSTWGPLEADDETWIDNVASVFQDDVPWVNNIEYPAYTLEPLEDDDGWMNNIASPFEDDTRQETIDRMQRESVAVGDTITGPEGEWRKTRYGSWVNVSLNRGGSGFSQTNPMRIM